MRGRADIARDREMRVRAVQMTNVNIISASRRNEACRANIKNAPKSARIAPMPADIGLLRLLLAALDREVRRC